METEPIPPLPVIVIKGFIQRPLLCVVLCVACLALSWWCHKNAVDYEHMSTGFQAEGLESPEDAAWRKIGLARDPAEVLARPESQVYLRNAAMLNHGSRLLGYTAIGWVALGAIGVPARRGMAACG